eukprot:PLAT7016.3.p1 GENE.PLAT7016.3~~PLAT7016.3.p1  ORF type:complete len:884 (-),score=457.70 PLAT7016.3:95-2677(-)
MVERSSNPFQELVQGPSLTKLKAMQEDGLQVVPLEPLSKQEIGRLIASAANVSSSSVPATVVSFVWKKTAGNPLFTQELVLEMQNSGIFTVEGKRFILPDGTDLSKVALPDTLQGTMMSRLNRLRPSCQWLLKLASVVGREKLPHAHLAYLVETEDEITVEKEAFEEDLNYLLDLELLTMTSVTPPLYSFKNALLSQVAYESMLYSLRRRLHVRYATYLERVYFEGESSFRDAEWYESRRQLLRQGGLTHVYSLLSHHWAKGEVYTRAIECLEKATMVAIRNFQSEEVIEYLQRAMLLDAECSKVARRLPDKPLPHSFCVKAAVWSRKMGSAYARLGRLQLALTLFQRALRHHGRMEPEAVSISGVMQAVDKLLGSRLQHEAPQRLNPEWQGLYESASSMLAIAHLCLQLDDAETGVVYAIHALRLVFEPGGESQEMAEALVLLSTYVLVLAGNSKLALRCAAEADRLAVSVSHPPTLVLVQLLSSTLRVGMNMFDAASSQLLMTIDIASTLHDRRSCEAARLQLAHMALLQGDLDGARDAYMTVLQSSQLRSDLQMAVAAHLGCARVLWERGHLHAYFMQVESAECLVAEHGDAIDVNMRLCTAAAVVQMRLYRTLLREDTLQWATQGWLKLRHVISYDGLFGYQPLLETHLAALESLRVDSLGDGDDSVTANEQRLFLLGLGCGASKDIKLHVRLRLTEKSARELLSSTKVLLQNFRTLYKTFPAAGPAFKLVKGMLMMHSGRRSKAMEKWRTAVKLAAASGQRLVEARALYNMGRYLPIDSTKRPLMLGRAKDLFESCGADERAGRAAAELLVTSKPGILSFSSKKSSKARNLSSLYMSYIPQRKYDRLGPTSSLRP